MRSAGLSPAVDYHFHDKETANHCVIENENFYIVAVNNKGDAERLPAEPGVDETLATLGANAIVAADTQLSDLLLECGILCSY